jgi:hypothetical protein
MSKRDALEEWIHVANLLAEGHLFPSRNHGSPHVGTRQYARFLEGGSQRSGLTQRPTARIRCGARRRR